MVHKIFHIKEFSHIMLKDLGSLPAGFPMPVLMVGTYNENDTVNVMNVAWGGICGMDKIALNLAPDRKTLANIQARKAFTVALADAAHIKEADFFGIATGNKMPDKFERSGLSAKKSRLEEVRECFGEQRVVGTIVNVVADEKVLDEKGKVDAGKLNAVMFDQFRNGYYSVGEKVAQAWNAGTGLMKN